MSFPASAESSLTPPTGGTRGDLQSPHTASEAGNVVSRVVRVPLERPDDADWRDLLALARESSQLANRLMIAWVAEAFGWPRPTEPSAVVQFKGRLSGDAYVAVTGEAKGVWQRVRARVLRGDQRLPVFASDRSLVVRGQYSGGKGGVRIEPDGKGYRVSLLLRGKDHGGWQDFHAWDPALAKDRYLSGTLMRMASGDYRCSKVTLQIDPRKRKLYALCAYDRPVPARVSGDRTATLKWEEDGSLMLRSAGHTRDFTREASFIRKQKEHFEGIIRRFRRTVGRGPRWKQVYRRNMPKTYEQWAAGRLHLLSAEIIAWCKAEGVSTLYLRPLGDGDWPAHRLETMLVYKGQHIGIAVEKRSGEDDLTHAGIRADAGEARKERKKATRVRQVARLVKSDLQEKRTKR